MRMGEKPVSLLPPLKWEIYLFRSLVKIVIQTLIYSFLVYIYVIKLYFLNENASLFAGYETCLNRNSLTQIKPYYITLELLIVQQFLWNRKTICAKWS